VERLVSACSPMDCVGTSAGWLALCHRASEYEERLVHAPRVAASAAAARRCMKSKKACDWPMKSPISVKNFRAPLRPPPSGLDELWNILGGRGRGTDKVQA
jgi:hypothetical protein